MIITVTYFTVCAMDVREIFKNILIQDNEIKLKYKFIP